MDLDVTDNTEVWRCPNSVRKLNISGTSGISIGVIRVNANSNAMVTRCPSTVQILSAGYDCGIDTVPYGVVELDASYNYRMPAECS